jgi:hypothetical protein
MDVLREQLLEAGLPSAKIDEIIGQQTFSLENVSQNVLPRMDE